MKSWKNGENFGFEQLDSCDCLSKQKDNQFGLEVLVYITGLMILGTDIHGITWGNSELKYLLKLTDLDKQNTSWEFRSKVKRRRCP